MNTENKLVFLLGPPRSGTTWLQGLLANHPDIGTAQESHLFNHFLQPMINTWNDLLQFDDGRGGIGLPAYLTEEEFMNTLRDTAQRIYSSVPEYHNHKIFLDKTPDHIRCIEDIRKVFPDAPIIVLLRNPADVIESLLSASKSWGKNWAPKSVVSAVRKYKYFFSTPGTGKLILEDPSLCVIRYENLKAEPENTLRTVFTYLNFAVDDQSLDRIINKTHSLRKYGEFALRSGRNVEEPTQFARVKKDKLTWLQRKVIAISLSKHSKAYGFTNELALKPCFELSRIQS